MRRAWARLLRAASAPGCAVALVLAGGCTGPAAPDEASADGPSPPPRHLVRVERVGAVGPYLDATLAGERFTRRFFFPRSADCEALLVEGREALYRQQGPFGVVADQAGARCEPVGVGSLPEWRDAMPRRRSQYLIPRVQAAYRPLLEGEDLLLVRGRFPLALELRWPEPMDSVAMLPASPPCRVVYGAETATLEFHAAGSEVFWLEVGTARCPIVGLAVPLGID